MKKLALALLLLQPVAIFAVADKPNPADFPVKVHVISSEFTQPNIQVLQTTVDGQPTELTGYSLGVLALGDYPARINPKIHGPSNPNTYDIYRAYDLLLPDGKTRTYTVTGISLAPANP